MNLCCVSMIEKKTIGDLIVRLSHLNSEASSPWPLVIWSVSQKEIFLIWWCRWQENRLLLFFFWHLIGLQSSWEFQTSACTSYALLKSHQDFRKKILAHLEQVWYVASNRRLNPTHLITHLLFLWLASRNVSVESQYQMQQQGWSNLEQVLCLLDKMLQLLVKGATCETDSISTSSILYVKQFAGPP